MEGIDTLMEGLLEHVSPNFARTFLTMHLPSGALLTDHHHPRPSPVWCKVHYDQGPVILSQTACATVLNHGDVSSVGQKNPFLSCFYL